MSEVKRYVFQHIVRNGTSRSFTKRIQQFTLAEDFDRVTAERDAALGREAAITRRESLFKEKLADCESALVDAQQRLTAADERADVMEGLLREVQVLITAEPFGVLSGMGSQSKRMDWYDKVSPVRERIDAALKPAEGGSDA